MQLRSIVHTCYWGLLNDFVLLFISCSKTYAQSSDWTLGFSGFFDVLMGLTVLQSPVDSSRTVSCCQ